METKICTKCGKEKSLIDFGKSKNTKDGLNYWCKECTKQNSRKNYQKIKNTPENKAKRKKYYLEHREELLLYSKCYGEEHKGRQQQYNKDYYKTHKEYFNEYNKTYIKNRRENDEVYRHKRIIRNLLYDAFVDGQQYKSSRCQKLTGLNPNELRCYLLNTFIDNYGYDWDGIEPVHIDHKIPLITGTTIEEVNELCFYTNLQLLKAHDNSVKGYKIQT